MEGRCGDGQGTDREGRAWGQASADFSIKHLGELINQHGKICKGKNDLWGKNVQGRANRGSQKSTLPEYANLEEL